DAHSRDAATMLRPIVRGLLFLRPRLSRRISTMSIYWNFLSREEEAATWGSRTERAHSGRSPEACPCLNFTCKSRWGGARPALASRLAPASFPRNTGYRDDP